MATTKLKIRYAPYIEDKHANFLSMVKASREALIGSIGTRVLTYDEWMSANHPEVSQGYYEDDGGGEFDPGFFTP